MITSVLPIAQGVATSAEFTISAGVTDRIFLTDADGGGVPFRSNATVQRKGNGGQFQNVAWLDFWSPSTQVQGPGTFRVVRRGDTAVGVDRDTGADAVAAINERLSGAESSVNTLFGAVSSKILAKQDGNNWYMTMPKAGARSTGLLYVLGKGKALGDSGAASVGGADDSSYALLRVVQVVETVIAVGCHHTPSGTSGTWTGPTQWTVPGSASGFGLGAWNAIKYYESAVQNSYKEYSITVGTDGKFSVGLMVGSGRATGVKVTLDTVDLDTFSAVASATNLWVKEYQTSPGTHTVRVTKTDAGSGPLQLLGCNCYHADRFPVGNSLDALGYARTANRYKFSSNGAIDYAMQEAGTGKFAGSYHGGETATVSKIMVDGTDVSGSASGSVVSGLDIQLVQETSVSTGSGSIPIKSTTQFLRSGGHTFRATADCGSIPLSYFYTHMDVVEVGFNKLAYPKSIDMSGYADNSQISIGPAEMTILENPSTGQKSATWSKQFSVSNNAYGGARIWVSAGNYFKPYNGPVVGASGAAIGSIAWNSAHSYF